MQLNNTINVKELMVFLLNNQGITLDPVPKIDTVLPTELKENCCNTLNWINTADIDWANIGSAILIAPPTAAGPEGSNTSVINVENPRLVFAKIMVEFFSHSPEATDPINITIGDRCQIHETVIFGENCVIGNNVKIGKKTRLGHNVVVESNVEIGQDCIIETGSVLGSTGFGYEKENDTFFRIPHVGGLSLGNRVEVGANTSIHKGTLGLTKIGSGVKIDDQSFIAHNVDIGKNTIICSHVVICGSTVVGENCWISPGTIIRDNLQVGRNCTLGIGTVLVKSCGNGKIIFGNPGKEN